MYNKIILIGNLTKDPELRYTPQGTPVATLRLAVNYRYKQSDEAKQETMFIDNVVFGKQAESCSKYLNKGSSVLVEGRLQERRWESNGQQRSKFEVIAQSVRFLSRRRSSQSAETDTSGGEGDIVPPEETTDLEPF
ncbi:MAG: single-stranded DNA-binding protein [Nitrospirae bacterium CG_4_9_14_3_um_filter_41_27]|nr:single-stranded DNA-binding protein [Nitrospirota bacterium]PIQ94656.1 MAG: single-stranded DNA-binding protein [Nitrospirae bacterium CG11_big_fil_rev_8_21_14_0_20_41_14]PIV41116.1 MAG: single-stranded DNA-binding protein [Nitrospirae bacterium CG02_land_8_20_14_3_00_41_53]PIW88111.1 MAG: single-stranded DNA-binding protein [Nitrospirae bacterium CG_4_8_14_3_um_filter_41_47]PJA79717.1 MAG: single-stranded DNA-binding protein [Nitrospirae bacterium CG_4_9_14_3_um_filter_41_27]